MPTTTRRDVFKLLAASAGAAVAPAALGATAAPPAAACAQPPQWGRGVEGQRTCV